MAILLIYMEKSGFEDYESASFVSFRFLGVLLFAFPLGLFIKGRNLKPLFYMSSIATPFLSLIIIEAIDLNWSYVLYAGFISCYGHVFIKATINEYGQTNDF